MFIPNLSLTSKLYNQLAEYASLLGYQIGILNLTNTNRTFHLFPPNLVFLILVNFIIIDLVTQFKNLRVICLSLGFLEAEPETKTIVQMMDCERNLRKNL